MKKIEIKGLLKLDEIPKTKHADSIYAEKFKEARALIMSNPGMAVEIDAEAGIENLSGHFYSLMKSRPELKDIRVISRNKRIFVILR